MSAQDRELVIAMVKIEMLVNALTEVRELIDGYVDVNDGDGGPVANNAMRATAIIDEALK